VLPLELLAAGGALASSAAVGTAVKAIAELLRRDPASERKAHHEMVVEIDGHAVNLSALTAEQRDQLAEKLLSAEAAASSPHEAPPAPPSE
jgi:hypothetical protein